MGIINFKKKNEDIEDDYDLESELAKLYEEPKWMNAFYNGAMGVSTGLMGSAILLAFGVPFGIGCAICIPLLGPASIVGINCLKKKSDRELAADMQEAQQLVKMFAEIDEKDHKIEKNTACFYQEIRQKDSLANVSSDVSNNINQFLYMINENYYERITSKNNLRREELIDKILEQIAIYVEKFGIYEFTLDELKPIIKGCFFIEDDLKKAILKEFKQSEYKFQGHKHYRILSQNIDSNKDIDVSIKELHEEKSSTDHHLKTFDVEDVEWYEYLLKCLDNTETEYGSPYLITWDLFSLRDIMAFMLTEFHSELVKVKGEFYNADVVMSFMYNAFIYASLNNTGRVGIYEIIQTFKKWTYLNNLFDLKLEILDGIFEKFELDYSMHPFCKTKKTKTKNKILSFPKNKD